MVIRYSLFVAYGKTRTRMMNIERKRKRVYIENKSESSSSSTIDGLPKDMLVEILAHVAAASFDTFFSVKQCCKLFAKVSDDDYIYKRITLEELTDKLWWTPKKADVLVRRCIQSGNPDSLYWQGLFEYFSTLNFRKGITLLRKAEQVGDISASYILGVIYLCSDDDRWKKEGVEILKKIHKEGKVVECRKRYERMTKGMWMNNRFIFEEAPSYNCPLRREHWKDGLWRIDARVRDEVHCEACLCQAETMFLYRYCPPALRER